MTRRFGPESLLLLFQRCSAAVAAAAALAALGGCSSSPSIPSSLSAGPAPPVSAVSPAGTIKHVVIVIQENRSFDDLFYGFPGADSATTGQTHTGAIVALAPVPLEDGKDVGHFHYSYDLAYDNGQMDGFDLEQGYGFNSSGQYVPVPQPPTYPYAYVPHAETQPYIDLAGAYTLADRMFQSNSGPSFPAHQYLIAGQSDDADEVPSVSPWGCDAPAGTVVSQLGADGRDTVGIFPCFDYTTLADLLDARMLTWRYYSPALSNTAGATFGAAFDAVRHIRFGSDWTSDVITPQTNVLTDVAAGTLADVTWIVPSFPDSDHPLGHSNSGPSWVSSIVNTIGSSPFWNSTAIFVVWDDWGGWYDHVAPRQLDSMGLGFRVPLIVVSPYAKHGYVSHVQHEFGSILHFTEEAFGLPSLGQADARADDFGDCFDFKRTPLPFARIRAPYAPTDFIHERQTGQAPDPA
ncbi:MAG: alkaline phosphatase family protein [Vulcanimicrobiaceae bacterium]